MARRNYFSHVTPGGEDLGDRLRDAGYGDPGDGWRAGENLGWGTGNRATPASLVDEWLASPGHKRNMLENSFREIGVGVAEGAPQPTDGGLPGATYTLNLGVDPLRLTPRRTVDAPGWRDDRIRFTCLSGPTRSTR